MKEKRKVQLAEQKKTRRLIMAKSKSYTPNDQRSNVKNPNNSSHQADLNNRSVQLNNNNSSSKTGKK